MISYSTRYAGLGLSTTHEFRTGCWVWCLTIWMVGLTDTDLPCQALSIINRYGGPTQTTHCVCQGKSDLVGRGKPLKAVGIVVVIPEMFCCVSSSVSPQIAQTVSSKRLIEGVLDGRCVLKTFPCLISYCAIFRPIVDCFCIKSINLHLRNVLTT